MQRYKHNENKTRRMKNKKFYIAKVLVIILVFVSYTHMVYEIASLRKMKETIKYIQVPKYYEVIDTVYLDAKKKIAYMEVTL